MPTTFRCTLVTPERQVLDEDVLYASIPAHDGQLGVQSRRAPLVAKLADGALRVDFASGGSRWFFLGGGFAQMRENKLVLLSEEALAAEEIVRQEAEQAMKDALALRGASDEAVQQRDRKLARARCLLALLRRQGAGK